MSGPSGAGAPPPSGVVCNSVLSFVASAQPMQSSTESEQATVNNRENEVGQSQNDKVPAGIKAICDACTKLYPDQPNPLQVTTRLKYWLGGDDPLDYISMYWNPGRPEEHIPPHWHYITFGLSDLHGDGRVHTRGPVSGFGFELSFRLEASPLDKAPPLWPSALCQALARYVFVTGNKLCPGDHISWHRPLDGVSRDTRVRHLLVARDSQLKQIHTPHGELELLQIVGCTSRELRAAQRGSGFDVLKKMSEDTNAGGAWLVTRMNRRVSVRVTSQGRPTLAGVQHQVKWIPLQRSQEEPKSPTNISVNVEQEIKETLQRGLSAMSAESNSNAAGKMSTDSFQMSSLEKALPEIPESMQGSWRGAESVQYFDGVHIFMNSEGASLLPLAIDGRVLDGSHFTWRGGAAAVTLTAANVGGVLATRDAPYAALGGWLQVLLTEDEAKEMSNKVGPLSSLCQSDSESDDEELPPPPRLPHTISVAGVNITVLPQ